MAWSYPSAGLSLPSSYWYNCDSASQQSPAPKKLVLVKRNIFIENCHALRDLREAEWFCSWNVWPPSCTTSAMAGREIVPRYCQIILSQSITLATCLSTCTTLTRVPRKVG